MARDRPQLSITLPRNFTFHYTEGDPPKTPEREVPAPVPRSPHAEGIYRVRRRTRPPVSSMFQHSTRSLPLSSDIAIPTIETPINTDNNQNVFTPQHSSDLEGYLAPVARKFTTLPRTPLSRGYQSSNDWNSPQDIGESISRPMSACSLVSDSSDASDGSLTSYPAGDGSCTSPESDAPDPFSSKYATVKRGKSRQWTALAMNEEAIQSGLSTKQISHVNWTAEMDAHLWSTYLTYLQDPTVTPFKMLPGTAPPLGVCHRVAREARRSWRGGRSCSRKPSDLLSPFLPQKSINLRSCSPETIKAPRSGSNTPTGSPSSKIAVWPKSGSSTRRRLRQLCKCKPTIAPHYQRLMQSRSPSPFSSSARTQSRSQSRLSEVMNSSPFAHSTSPFNTRDVQLSLTASTSASMQRDGPMAQLTAGDQLPPSQSADTGEWFNEPPVPFASEPSIPSDVAQHTENEVARALELEAAGTPRLGSPFGFHTWGPSRSKQRMRPSTSRVQSSDANSVGPSLRSPLRLHETFPYQGVQKRRAIHSLEDELSPGGSSMQQSLLDNLFGGPDGGRHRRVRSRGFSLGDMMNPNPLENLFTPPTASNEQIPNVSISQPDSSDGMAPTTPTAQIRRLGSPFHGISPRPTRVRGPSRHLATSSLDSYDTSIFSSIGEALGQIRGPQPSSQQ